MLVRGASIRKGSVSDPFRQPFPKRNPFKYGPSRSVYCSLPDRQSDRVTE